MKKMECKECRIVCDGKEVAVINCGKDGMTVRPTKEGMEMMKEFGCC